MQTTVVQTEEGLKCQRFGNITGIDCSCLRDTDCKGCFIYQSLVESRDDFEKISFEDALLNQAESLVTIN